MEGRGGGPSPGNKAPASANMHQCRQSAARSSFEENPDISTRGRSMPSRELVKVYSSKAVAHGLSLGFFSVDRRDLMPPVGPTPGQHVANGKHEVSTTESQESQANPFADIAT